MYSHRPAATMTAAPHFVPWSALGLRILSPWRSMLAGLTIGAAAGAYIAASDLWLYRSILPPPGTPGVAGGSMLSQLAQLIPLSALDEILWRGLMVSALIWVAVILAGHPYRWCYWMAIAAVALDAWPMTHLSYFAALTWTPLTVTRELMIHGGAGILWGWLYWTRGLTAAIAGHVGVHLTVQPLLAILG